MLLCTNQENPIEFRRKKIWLQEELLNLHFMTYGTPVGEGDIRVWLSCSAGFREDRWQIIDEMPQEYLSIVIQDEMKKELSKVLEWGIGNAVHD